MKLIWRDRASELRADIKRRFGAPAQPYPWFDNSNAFRLGYRPQDNGEDFAAEILAKEQPGDLRAETYQGGTFVHIEAVENPAPLPSRTDAPLR